MTKLETTISENISSKHGKWYTMSRKACALNFQDTINPLHRRGAGVGLLKKNILEIQTRNVAIKILFAFLLMFMPLQNYVWAQVFPVQVITEITPPYSVYLSDYTTPGSNKLAVNILLTDINRFNYPVKLRLVIEGEGILIRTSASYMPTQIILDGGSPLRLTGEELSAYFNPGNLDFQGYSKEKFRASGTLPEGIYRIGFQVLDYNKSIPISSTGSSTAWLILNDPPIFNTPEKNAKLMASEPQNIMFQWMPRHLGSPNSAFNTEYIFQLFEIWPTGLNPDQVVLSTSPLLEKTLYSTSYIYTNTIEASLIPGRQYAYRVQARDAEGRDLFRNKGYSEVQMFTYGDPCDLPTGIEARAGNPGSIIIDWEPTPYNTGYYIQYREAGDENNEWFPTTVYINSLTIDKLKHDTKYEYQVQGQCGTVSSNLSETYSVRTQPKKQTKVECGLNDPTTTITNTLPLTSLLPGDIITSGSFDVQVTKATGGNGKWSGEGFLHVPFMGVKVRAEFKDININEEFQVTSGRIVSVYNPDSKFVYQVGGNDEETSDESTATETNETPSWDTTYTIAETIDSIFVSDNGDIIVVTDNGETITLETGEDDDKILVTDSNGTEYVIEDGKIVSGGDAGGSSGELNEIITDNSSEKEGPSIRINGVKYYDGMTAYFIKEEKREVTLELLNKDGELLKKTKWSIDGEDKGKQENYTISIAETSEDENGTSIKATKGSNEVGIKFIVMEISLDEISYSGSGNSTSIAYIEAETPGSFPSNLCSIEAGIAKYSYAPPQWKSNRDKSYPVVYARNSIIQASPKFKTIPSSLKGKIYIKANTNIEIGIEETQKEFSSDNEYIQLEALPFNKKLENECYEIDPLIIGWSISFDGQNWKEIGETKNQVFITLQNPISDICIEKNIYEFVYQHIGENKINNPNSFVEQLWNVFESSTPTSPIEFTKNNGKIIPLRYYANASTNGLMGSQLLYTGDGQCLAWAELFLLALQTQGISATQKSYSSSNPGESYLINNWFFEKNVNHKIDYNGTNYSHYNYSPYDEFKRKNDGTYTWGSENVEVNELDGIPGQGNKNPVSDFSHHYIVEYNGNVYDPSYGKEYPSKESWNNNSVAGYFIKEDLDYFLDGEVVYRYLFRENSVNTQLGESVVSNEEAEVSNELFIEYFDDVYKDGQTIYTLENSLDKIKPTIKDKEGNTIPFNEIEWEGIKVDKKNGTIDISNIIDKDVSFSISTNNLSASFKAKKIKAKLACAPDEGTYTNKYGYDNMDVSDVNQHYINVELNKSTYLRLKKLEDKTMVKLISDPDIVSLSIEDSGSDLFVKVDANKGISGDAKIKVVDKNDENNVLSSINLIVYEPKTINGEIYSTYDPNFEKSPSSGLSANIIKENANYVLKHVVVQTSFNKFVDNPVNYDINGNKVLDYFINLGGPNRYNPELWKIYNGLGGFNPNNVILLRNEPVKRFYFSVDYKASDEQTIIEMGTAEVLITELRKLIGKQFVIEDPSDSKKSEYFILKDIQKNSKTKNWELIINKKLKKDHLATGDLNGNMNVKGNYITLANNTKVKLSGLQSIRDVNQNNCRAMISVLIKTDNVLLGRVVAHEQLHGASLEHVTNQDNIMYYSIGSFDEYGNIIMNTLSQEHPVRKLILNNCDKIKNADGTETCNDNGNKQSQWDDVHK